MSRSQFYKSSLIALWIFFLAPSLIRGQELPQVNAGNATGVMAYNPYGGAGENINYSNGNLGLNIPLVSLPGRNGHNLDLALEYDSKIFVLNHFSANSPYNYYWRYESRVPSIVSNTNSNMGIGWRLNLPVLQATPMNPFSYEPLLYCYGDFIITLGDGSKHILGNRTQCFQNDSSPSANPPYGPVPADNIYVTDSDDATFLRLDSTNSTDFKLFTKDGTIIHFSIPASINGSTFTTIASQIEDSNGNKITIASTDASQWNQVTSITDTVGRVVTFAWGTAPDHSLSSISYKDSNGSTQTIALAYASTTIAPTFQAPPGAQNPASSTPSLLSTITLPNLLKYTIQYNTFAEITKLTYPTGGYTRYDYSAFQNYWYFVYSTASTAADFREVTARHVCGAANSVCGVEDSTTYTPTVSGTITNNQYFDVLDPIGNKTRHVISYQSSSCGCSLPFSARETSRIIYQGQITPLQTIQTDYSDLGASGLPQDWSLPIRATTTLNDSGQVTKTEVTYDTIILYAQHQGGGAPSNVTRYIDNSLTESKYEFGSPSPGALVRQTVRTWLKINPINGKDYASNAIHILGRPASVVIKDGSTNTLAQTQYEYDSYTPTMAASGATQHDSVFGSAYTTRGNVTARKQWRNTDGAWLVTSNQYDDAGNVLKITDPNSHSTQFSYSDSWGNTVCAPTPGVAAAYPTKVTNALNQFTSEKYNSCSGSVSSFTDLNGLTTSLSYDSTGRLSQVVHPDGGHENITRGESTYPLTETRTTTIDTLQNLIIMRVFDGVGRVTQAQLKSDPQGVVLTDTSYDALGRPATVSNRYRTGGDATSSPGTTVFSYDALGRQISETYADNSVYRTAYCGSSTLVTDPTGKQRRSRTDALRRLVEIDEPNAVGVTLLSSGCPGTGEPIWVTSYSYDTLGNLTSVLQNGSHQRTFTYDSLSHLLTSANPEVGTIAYSYDANANIATKKDARNITATYGYDALNRETSRAYSNGDPSVSTAYDQPACLGLSACSNIGHRTSMTDAAGSESWAYQIDPANFRSIHKDQRTTNSSPSNITKTSTYFLDLAGNVTQSVYPTGRTVNYTFDAANRPSTTSDASNGIAYVTDFQTAPTSCLAGKVCYTPQGTFYALSIGQSSTFTGLNLSHSYNNRLQPLEFKASSAAGNAIDITYNFVDPVTTHNADHLYAITNNLDTTRSQVFTYDQLNRITSALTTSTHATSPIHCWGETYSLDPWANLQSIAATTNSNYIGCSQESGFTKTADGNNHFTDFTYDPSGNTQSDAVNAYSWNGEGQLKSGGSVNYLYDGDGRRVAKVGSKLYWYGASNEILAETDAAGVTQNEYIFFGGQRVAVLPAAGNPSYYVEDLLGTSRVITTNTGAVCYDADFYPFGGERTPYTNTCPQNYKFEGNERDAETTNDDFGARPYSNRFGRWLSADWSAIPAPVPYASLANPQTLNLYAMVAEDPESFADLDGHDGWGAGSDNNPTIQPGDVEWMFQETLSSRPPKPAGKCGFLCLLKFVFFGDPHKTRPAPDAEDPVGPAIANGAVGLVNLAGRAACALSSGCTSVRQDPYYKPRTQQQAREMNQVDLALLFLPGFEEEGLATQEHHIATWYGRYGKILSDFFEEAGMDIKAEAENLMDLPGHSGRHTANYHEHVIRTIRRYTDGKSGDAFTKGLLRALRSLRRQLEDNPRLPYQ